MAHKAMSSCILASQKFQATNRNVPSSVDMPSKKRTNNLVTDANGWTTVSSGSKSKYRGSAILRAHADDSSSLTALDENFPRIATISQKKLEQRFRAVQDTFLENLICAAVRALCKKVRQKRWVDKGICLGLGSLSEAQGFLYPLHQLCMLLIIKDEWKLEEIVAYDPVFTNVDIAFLKSFNINVIKGLEMQNHCKSQDLSASFIYLPHGSLHVSWEYMMYKPGVYLGNSVEVWTLLNEEDDNRKLDQMKHLVESYDHETLPEATIYMDGKAFNDIEMYWLKEEAKHNEMGLSQDARQDDEELDEVTQRGDTTAGNAGAKSEDQDQKDLVEKLASTSIGLKTIS